MHAVTLASLISTASAQLLIGGPGIACPSSNEVRTSVLITLVVVAAERGGSFARAVRDRFDGDSALFQVPQNLAEGKPCGGACASPTFPLFPLATRPAGSSLSPNGRCAGNLVGNCAAGLECVVPEAVPAPGMPLRGVVGLGGMQQLGTCTRQEMGCGGCEEVEGGEDADGVRGP